MKLGLKDPKEMCPFLWQLVPFSTDIDQETRTPRGPRCEFKLEGLLLGVKPKPDISHC